MRANVADACAAPLFLLRSNVQAVAECAIKAWQLGEGPTRMQI